MTPPEFERFVSVRTIGSPQYAPDGSVFAYLSNTTGISNIWLQPDGGGFPRQVTSLVEHRVSAFQFSPDGSRIAFVADHHGDEMHQVYVIDTAGGWPRRLTDAPQVQFTLGGWTPDGARVAVTGNDRDPTQMDPQLIHVDSGDVTRLMTGGQFYAMKVSPDGSAIAVLEFVTNTRQRIWLLDLASGERRAVLGAPLDDGGADVKAEFLDWRPDGTGFYALTDADDEFSYLVFVAVADGAVRTVLRENADVDGIVVARLGNRMAAAVNDGGASRLALLALEDAGERVLAAPTLPLGVIAGASFHPSGDRLLLALSRPREATNLSLVDIASGDSTTVEQSMLGGIAPDTLIDPVIVAYPSFDRDIPALLYRPNKGGPLGAGPFPVLLTIHGGPEDQERPSYGMHGLYQYLVSRGIGVLAPNIRGSTGYGKTYQSLIHRDWGGDELRDIEAAADYLESLDWVDPRKLAVAGGSFGGFATLSAMTRLPTRWAAGVDLVGPANLVTFVDSVPPFWRQAMESWVGDAVKDRDLLVERSPITYVDRLRAPLLVIQGANDPRVVKAESDQLVERVRSRGVEVEYVVDETAGHGPADRDGWVRWLHLMAEFLERHLLA